MTVGILGAGQLGRMMALAGYPLGLDCLLLDPSADSPAGRVAPTLQGAFTDPAQLQQLAKRCEVVTFDWENVPAEALSILEASTRIAPPRIALAIAQDRLEEKSLFARLKIPTNRSVAVDSLADLLRAAQQLGLPAVLKTRRLGYDGKGQRVLRSAADLEPAWQALGAGPLLLEAFVPFDYEVSVIGVRSSRGEVAVYPLNRNLHRDGILRLTRAPWNAPKLALAASRSLKKVLTALDYVGVLAIEFFVVKGRLIANEMAPRVHNSGHWTLEGAVTSQFENHLRAVLGMPLGQTAARGHSLMINLIGQMPDRQALLKVPGLHLHDYGKSPRPGRKLGHCTVVESTAAAANRRAASLLKRIDSGRM